MSALARYGLAEPRVVPTKCSPAERRRGLEILILELEGHDLLLLDEPTDNLDIDSPRLSRRRSTGSPEPSSPSPMTGVPAGA